MTEDKLTSKDLMVGDWVMDTYHNKPMRVETIKRDMIILEGQDRFKKDGFSPILITPEILKKNGFSDYNGEGHYVLESEKEAQWSYSMFQKREDGKFQLEVMKNGETICGITSKFIYVHDLQHAFYMCGIDKEIEL